MDARAKSIRGNELVRVVVLEDAADSLQRLQVLVAVRVPIMQRVVLGCLAIRGREVDGDDEVQLAATKDVFEEVHNGLELKTDDRDVRVVDLEIGNGAHLVYGHHFCADALMVAGVAGCHKVHAEFSGVVCVAQQIRVYQELMPLLFAAPSKLALRLEDGLKGT